jgi:hypothetical protein
MTAFDWAQRSRVWDYHMGDGVDVGDVLEAALACRLCLDIHTPALSGRPLSPRIVKRWLGQADGWVDPPLSDET